MYNEAEEEEEKKNGKKKKHEIFFANEFYAKCSWRGTKAHLIKRALSVLIIYMNGRPHLYRTKLARD